MKRVIGITGGIASGKSNVTSIIRDYGYQVIDCDEIYKELSMPGNTVYNAIISTFGQKYLTKDKKIDKKMLGQLIFNDYSSKILLNKVTHPLIMEEVKKRIEILKDNLLFIDIPLLFEAHLEYLCDKIVCVYVNKDEQVKRLMERDHIDRDYALAKIHSQMELDKKKELSNYVIDSTGSFEETKEQMLVLLKELEGDVNNGKF